MSFWSPVRSRLRLLLDFSDSFNEKFVLSYRPGPRLRTAGELRVLYLCGGYLGSARSREDGF